MNEIRFEEQHEAQWAALAQSVQGGKHQREAHPHAAREVPRLFRRAAAELALARDRQYRTSLIDRLHSIVLAAHLAVHGARARRPWGLARDLARFLFATFPAQARRQWRFAAAAAAALFGPMLGMIAALHYHPDFVYYLVSPETLAQVQSMYDPKHGRVGMGRDAGTDALMFGFYIANNVRIDLQCLAGGILFGLGTLAALLGNGLFIGAIAGHLTNVGYVETFWGFVAGHSALELMGAVLSGASGLRIGYALVAPGRASRGAALRAAAIDAAPLLYGAALMTTCAAVIEAFWSSRTGIPFFSKVVFGLFMWAVVLGVLGFGGRRGS